MKRYEAMQRAAIGEFDELREALIQAMLPLEALYTKNNQLWLAPEVYKAIGIAVKRGRKALKIE